MTNEYKYETIEIEKNSGIFPTGSDFKAEKSNRIIKNLVEKIQDYEKAREMKTKYYKEINNKGEERIIKAEMKSKEGIIRGIISYHPRSTFNGTVYAKFNFNSNNPADKQEYLGLVKILKNM